jgi:hypothetical protein
MAMTLIELSDEEAAALRAKAEAAGLTLEAWVRELAAAEANVDRPAAERRSLQDELTPDEWVRQFDAWVDSHDRTTRLLSDEAISRESIYPDRI